MKGGSGECEGGEGLEGGNFWSKLADGDLVNQTPMKLKVFAKGKKTGKEKLSFGKSQKNRKKKKRNKTRQSNPAGCFEGISVVGGETATEGRTGNRGVGAGFCSLTEARNPGYHEDDWVRYGGKSFASRRGGRVGA